MAVVRLSVTTPNPGDQKRVEDLFDELEAFCAQQDGHILGFRFNLYEPEVQVGRISVWRSREDAQRVAGMDHVQAIRSQIHLHIQPGHIENLYDIGGTPFNLPSID